MKTINTRLLLHCAVFLIIILFYISLSFAGENINNVVHLDVDKTIKMALETSEEFEIKNNEVLKMRSKYKEAKSALYPHIYGEATWFSNFEYPDIPQTTYTRDFDVSAGLTVNQTVFTFGKISSSIKAAQEFIEVSSFNRENTKQEVIYAAKMAYYNAHLANMTLEIAQESYDNVQKSKMILEKRSAGGRVSKNDNIKILADLASRIPIVSNARAGFVSAIETLKIVAGIEYKTKLDLIEEFGVDYSILEREQLVNLLFKNQPRLQALDKTVSAQETIVKLKKAEYFPDISAFTSLKHKGSGNDYYVGNENLENYGTAGIKVNVPIWTAGQTREQLRQARIDKEVAYLQLRKTQKFLLLELEKKISVYNEMIITLEANNDAIALAEESYKLSQDLFESGQISVTDLNDAELLLTNQKLRKQITLFKLNSTLAMIKKLTLMENN